MRLLLAFLTPSINLLRSMQSLFCECYSRLGSRTARASFRCVSQNSCQVCVYSHEGLLSLAEEEEVIPRLHMSERVANGVV